MKNILKYLLVFLISIVFIIPIILRVLKIEVKPLGGYIVKTEKPVFYKNMWLDGNYQKEYEKYFNQSILGREILVRIYNQIRFSLYKQSSIGYFVVGKEGYLYETDYIHAYLGEDYVHEEILADNIFKLKRLQDTLQQLNKELLIVLAAGKGTYFSEYIPDEYKINGKSKSNYDYYSEELPKNNINTIDFNKWFKSIKNTSEYSLFTKNGIHWSTYGSYMASDSLVKYISKMRKVDLPNFKLNGISKEKPEWSTDDDAEKAMNLMFKSKDINLGYPMYEIENIEKRNTSLVTVSDSYFYGLLWTGIYDKIFVDSEFWYYFNDIDNTREDGKKKISEINVKEEVLKRDVVVIMGTEISLKHLGFGAIDKLYEEFFGEKLHKSDKHMFYYNELLRNTTFIRQINDKLRVSSEKSFKEYLEEEIERKVQSE